MLNELFILKNQKQAAVLSKFFKTGKGQYGYGDKFLGIKVPILRKISKKYYKKLSIKELEKLLENEFHEVRQITVFIMVLKYENGDEKVKKQIFDLYIKSVNYINNWDLVDLSARQIVGDYAYQTPEVIYTLAASNHLWSERIVIVASFYNIKKGEFELTLELVKRFINHKHDLIHKACGWMLREIGKKDLSVLTDFLNNYADKLPRTTLRYSIEKMSKDQRDFYLTYGTHAKEQK